MTELEKYNKLMEQKFNIEDELVKNRLRERRLRADRGQLRKKLHSIENQLRDFFKRLRVKRDLLK